MDTVSCNKIILFMRYPLQVIAGCVAVWLSLYAGDQEFHIRIISHGHEGWFSVLICKWFVILNSKLLHFLDYLILKLEWMINV